MDGRGYDARILGLRIAVSGQLKARHLATDGGSRRLSVVKQAVKSLSLKYLALIAFLALVHLFVSHLNLKLSLVYPLVTPIWITAGIELAAMILYGYRVWPAIFVGSLLSHVSTLGSSFLLPVGAPLEAVAGAYLINKFARGAKAFDTATGVFRFVFLGCICSPL